MLHLDIMDGHFVPNLTFGPLLVAAIRRLTRLPLDAHLMITAPELYLPQFAEAGADIITVHAEATPHLHRCLQQVRSLGCQAGVALNPATGIDVVEQIAGDIDLLLVMSVNPGFGGQAFIEAVLPKIQHCRGLLDERNDSCLLQVDGGLNRDTITRVAAAGADTFVVGSALFGASSVRTELEELRQRLPADA